MIERYSRPEFAAIWSDAARFELWLEVELAACRAMEARDLVPHGTADQVAHEARGKLVPGRIQAIEATTRHDVIAFLTHVEELAGPPARWLHLGMTSSDVLDTALALQCGSALDRILGGVEELAAALAERARQHKDTACIGRSHGIHAEPITAGVVFCRWYAELGRARERLERARRAIRCRQAGRRGRRVRQPRRLRSRPRRWAGSASSRRRRPARSSRATATPR